MPQARPEQIVVEGPDIRVEALDGRPPERKHLPHRLIVTNSSGDSADIVAIVKTQGSDTKLVAQMQPYYEAKSLSRWELAGHGVPRW